MPRQRPYPHIRKLTKNSYRVRAFKNKRNPIKNPLIHVAKRNLRMELIARRRLPVIRFLMRIRVAKYLSAQ